MRNFSSKLRILSLCTSAGLWDKAFQLAGAQVIPGCELMAHKRAIYRDFVDPAAEFLAEDLGDLSVRSLPNVDLIIGGIPCQTRSKTRAMRAPKFPDLLPQLRRVLDQLPGVPYLLENVGPLDIPGAAHTRLDAMHFARPHQSRARWFTHSPELKVPEKTFPGTVDSLMAYPAVAARIYGPKRGAVLQGWPEFADLNFTCARLQEALADGVPRGLADAWINANGWRV